MPLSHLRDLGEELLLAVCEEALLLRGPLGGLLPPRELLGVQFLSQGGGVGFQGLHGLDRGLQGRSQTGVGCPNLAQSLREVVLDSGVVPWLELHAYVAEVLELIRFHDPDDGGGLLVGEVRRGEDVGVRAAAAGRGGHGRRPRGRSLGLGRAQDAEKLGLNVLLRLDAVLQEGDQVGREIREVHKDALVVFEPLKRVFRHLERVEEEAVLLARELELEDLLHLHHVVALLSRAERDPEPELLNPFLLVVLLERRARKKRGAKQGASESS